MAMGIPDLKSPSFRLDCSGRTLDLASGPAIMGIMNLTPDSFYDGGAYVGPHFQPDLDKALHQAAAMIRAGASIIDVGGESTRPGSQPVSVDVEIGRTVPFISQLRRTTDVLISIDTYKAEVAEQALRAGAGIVNDISGFTFDSKLPEICRKFRCGVVLMHTPRRPETLRWSRETGSCNSDIVRKVIDALRHSVETARRYGVEAVIIDPGFGFGKSVGENFRLLAGLDELHTLGCPVLAGVSRKSFLGEAIRLEGSATPPPSERLTASIAAETIALLNGADILRVHDVEAAAQARSVFLSVRKACR
jgi:dihydropteroate synthase